MKESELSGDESKKRTLTIGASLSLQEAERALDDAGIYEGINPLAYTSPALEKLGYSSLAEAWLKTDPFGEWASHTYSWSSYTGFNSSSDDVEAGSTYESHLDKFVGDMKKYGVSEDTSTRFHKEVISDWESSKHGCRNLIYLKKEKISKKWPQFLGRSKKEWGNSSLEQFIWAFLQKHTWVLAV